MAWLSNPTRSRRGPKPPHRAGHTPYHPDIDAERDQLTDDLKAAKVVEAIYEVSGVGPTLNGRNGEGDRYYTDGKMKISRLVAGCNVKAVTAVELDNPPLVDLKNATWEAIAALLSSRRPGQTEIAVNSLEAGLLTHTQAHMPVEAILTSRPL